MTSSRSSKTSHARIKSDILEQIIDGTWQPGFQLPIETVLADSYGVSRMTMNKVLTQLANEGYVYRRKKKGTFVAEPRAQSAVMEITDIEREVLALDKTYRWDLLTRQNHPMSAKNLEQLTLPATTDTGGLFLEGIHYSCDTPFCLETRYINSDIVPNVLEQDFACLAPGSWLLKVMPWTKAAHQIRAINVSNPSARLLELDPGSACLEIIRRTEIDATWVTWARLLYPGQAHQLIAQF
ncbi:UTRA domain-containing protein [Cohaesibacter celericrescens]|uniref:Histidine utilization repressor n=1 Tax=Cohaesibacter celericrescens TaxID=2067669 RepID=A0A2N5XRY0_9HYPH|nr:UTRA domain-containing protein [Cohaesibacter celericrescens]PLW77215.1 histidine utilization repressor [Cohaesibacter celericrescens]